MVKRHGSFCEYFGKRKRRMLQKSQYIGMINFLPVVAKCLRLYYQSKALRKGLRCCCVKQIIMLCNTLYCWSLANIFWLFKRPIVLLDLVASKTKVALSTTSSGTPAIRIKISPFSQWFSEHDHSNTICTIFEHCMFLIVALLFNASNDFNYLSNDFLRKNCCSMLEF